MAVSFSVFKTPDVVPMAATFLARYEFIDTMQTGFPVEDTACDRRFVSRLKQKGLIASPRNLFFFGRGGRKNLSCNFYFTGLPTERIRLRVERMYLGTDSCATGFDHETQRYMCRTLRSNRGRHAFLTAVEPWQNLQLPVGCLCSNVSVIDNVVVLETLGSHLFLSFTIGSMSAREDFTDFGFEGTYEFLSGGECDSKVHQLHGPEGDISVEVPIPVDPALFPVRCRWMLEAGKGKSLFLTVKGREVASGCGDENVFLVWAVPSLRLVGSVCASEAEPNGVEDQVELFSHSWFNESRSPDSAGDKFLLEVVASQPGTFRAKWLEVTRPFVRTLSGETLRNTDCLYECPELNACISPDLWCDGTAHCPSGYDEMPEHCRKFPTLYVAIGAGLSFLCILVVSLLLANRCWNYTRRKGSQPVPSEELQLEATPA